MTRLLAAGLLVVILMPAYAGGQTGESPRPFAWDVARAVLIDPTTYVPAVISREAMLQDWKSSQVFFAHGWLEGNQGFTVTGQANDVPVSYDEGKRRIGRESLVILGKSALNNLAVGVGERLLTAKYPERRKLIRTVSWIERIAYASVTTYMNTAGHVRQARANARLARDLAFTR
jgi:hypothetical protein